MLSVLSRGNNRTNAKPVAIFTICVALVLSLCSCSYIHPDEHFQAIEILMWKWNKYSYGVTVPWEFTMKARSFVPLFLWYSPLYPLIHTFQPNYSALLLMTIMRAYNFLIYLIVTAFVVKSQFKGKKTSRFYRTLILIFTSYITVSYQSHTFSNGIETNLLLLALYLLNKTIIKGQRKLHIPASLTLGVICSIGCFNRITFLGFLFLPILRGFFTKSFRFFARFIFLVMLAFALTSFVQIKLDTLFFESESLVVAPLNNLLYNLNYENLSLHGLHSRLTHMFVNLPQLLGPLMILLVSRRFLNLDIMTLSIVGSLVILSIFPHQELRFLIPLQPLFCILFMKTRLRISTTLFTAWVLFNSIMYIVMGVFHQAGNHLFFQDPLLSKTVVKSVHIWWKTYSPPTWMYLQPDMTVATTTFAKPNGQELFTNYGKGFNQVVDLKGCDVELLDEVLRNYLYNVHSNCVLVLPSTVEHKLKQLDYQFSLLWETQASLDLDHFDFTNTDSLTSGLKAYYVQS